MGFKTLMVSGNHRNQAMYNTFSEHSDNANVQHCIKTGMEDCTLLDPRTPPTIIIWFAENANDFHGVGIQTNFMQILDLSELLVADFGEMRKARRQAAAAAARNQPTDSGTATPEPQQGYEAEFLDFVKKNSRGCMCMCPYSC